MAFPQEHSHPAQSSLHPAPEHIPATGSMLRIGVLSDTHGLFRPELTSALAGVDHILHAGDVGDITILDRLREIAPITAIRGNIDTDGATAALPETEIVELGGRLIYLLHDLKTLDLVPQAAGISVIISGHTHQAWMESRNGILYLNPGSVGPRRFKLPITLARLTITSGNLHAELVTLAL